MNDFFQHIFMIIIIPFKRSGRLKSLTIFQQPFPGRNYFDFFAFYDPDFRLIFRNDYNACLALQYIFQTYISRYELFIIYSYYTTNKL